tara:strand:- start:3068 stop:3367 length:300 start_codon:yes stop_codon:yes gene_type:complete
MINFYYDPILGLRHFCFEAPREDFKYSRDKARRVVFSGGKESLLLRQFIKEKSKNLSSVTQGSYVNIRKIFIEAYNIGGTKAVETVYNQSILNLLKKNA